MRENLTRPILAIAIGLLVLGGTLWIIDPIGGLFPMIAPSATASEQHHYPTRPVGLDGPAGQCVVCHSVEKGGPMRVAPNLWGIVGAPKARMKGFGYSIALASAGGVWTKEDLDRYLANPDQFLPGTKKTITGLPDAKTRAELIAHLATLKD